MAVNSHFRDDLETLNRTSPETTRPRLGFAGVGWIGKNRLRAIEKADIADLTAITDTHPEALANLSEERPEVRLHDHFDRMLQEDLDGVVIATPSALHAPQTLQALSKGLAVFCQKPLGRNEEETRQVVETARERDLLLGVDFTYRQTAAVRQLRKIIRRDDLGAIHSVELTFHNAYGPDKGWYHNRELAGGGCLMDLGIHLVDLLYHTLELSPDSIRSVCSRVSHRGRPLEAGVNLVEDHATSLLLFDGGPSVQLSCSWNLPAGRDAVIEMALYGEKGGARFHNLNGSFYDFVTDRYDGTSTERLCEPPDDWEGREAVRWVRQLSRGNRFDPEAERIVDVARTLDLIYQNSA